MVATIDDNVFHIHIQNFAVHKRYTAQLDALPDFYEGENKYKSF